MKVIILVLTPSLENSDLSAVLYGLVGNNSGRLDDLVIDSGRRAMAIILNIHKTNVESRRS
jgi:hypothetical protein